MTDEPKDLSIKPIQNVVLTKHTSREREYHFNATYTAAFVSLWTFIVCLVTAINGPWVIASVLCLTTLIGLIATAWHYSIRRIYKRLEKKQPVKAWPLSQSQIYIYATGVLLQRINRLINGWNSHEELIKLERAVPFPDAEELYENLVRLKEDTDRRAKTAVVFLKMIEDGNLETQDPNQTPLIEDLEDMSAMEDKICRSLNGVVQGLNSPLARDLNALRLEGELDRELSQTAALEISETNRPRGRITTTGS